MTWSDHGGTSADDRRTALIVGLVAATVAALFFIVPVDFYLNYFMKDMVGWGDHVLFLCIAVMRASPLSAIYAVLVTRLTDLPLARSAVGCFLVTMSVLLFAGAGYSALSLSAGLDYAVGAEWPNAMCGILALALGGTALGSFAAGRRLLSLRRV